jgi:molybdopterin synthase sulfur carrier subunit
MKVKLKYFASIREAIGQGSEELLTQASTVAQLRAELIAKGQPYADCLAEGKAVRMALDQLLVESSAALHDGCEVAFFPPVTGG